MPIITDKSSSEEAVPANTPLPVTGNAAQKAEAPQKDIHKTVGGRIVDYFIYYVIGFVANSGLSLVLTYGANPRPAVKNAKESLARGLTGLFKSANHTKTLDVMRSLVESSFMVCSGFITTAVMMPFLSRREKMAYKINRWLHKDEGVLPDEMRDKSPKTLEDKVNQQIDKRVNKKESGTDLWISRFLGVGVFLAADGVLNRMDRMLESAGKHSITTLSWLSGQKLFEVLPKAWPAKINDWFSRHGASLENLKANSHDHYMRLEHAETQYAKKLAQPVNLNRMVIAEQSRLLIKEVSWTLIVAWIVRRLTSALCDHRVSREEKKVMAELRQEGLIPEGYNVIPGETVRLEPKQQSAEPAETETTARARKPKSSRPVIDKASNHAQGVESRKGEVLTALAM